MRIFLQIFPDFGIVLRITTLKSTTHLSRTPGEFEKSYVFHLSRTRWRKIRKSAAQRRKMKPLVLMAVKTNTIQESKIKRRFIYFSISKTLNVKSSEIIKKTDSFIMKFPHEYFFSRKCSAFILSRGGWIIIMHLKRVHRDIDSE